MRLNGDLPHCSKQQYVAWQADYQRLNNQIAPDRSRLSLLACALSAVHTMAHRRQLQAICVYGPCVFMGHLALAHGDSVRCSRLRLRPWSLQHVALRRLRDRGIGSYARY